MNLKKVPFIVLYMTLLGIFTSQSMEPIPLEPVIEHAVYSSQDTNRVYPFFLAQDQIDVSPYLKLVLSKETSFIEKETGITSFLSLEELTIFMTIIMPLVLKEHKQTELFPGQEVFNIFQHLTQVPNIDEYSVDFMHQANAWGMSTLEQALARYIINNHAIGIQETSLNNNAILAELTNNFSPEEQLVLISELQPNIPHLDIILEWLVQLSTIDLDALKQDLATSYRTLFNKALDTISSFIAENIVPIGQAYPAFASWFVETYPAAITSVIAKKLRIQLAHITVPAPHQITTCRSAYRNPTLLFNHFSVEVCKVKKQYIVQLWDLATGTKISSIPLPEEVTECLSLHYIDNTTCIIDCAYGIPKHYISFIISFDTKAAIKCKFFENSFLVSQAKKLNDTTIVAIANRLPLQSFNNNNIYLIDSDNGNITDTIDVPKLFHHLFPLQGSKVIFFGPADYLPIWDTATKKISNNALTAPLSLFAKVNDNTFVGQGRRSNIYKITIVGNTIHMQELPIDLTRFYHIHAVLNQHQILLKSVASGELLIYDIDNPEKSLRIKVPPTKIFRMLQMVTTIHNSLLIVNIDDTCMLYDLNTGHLIREMLLLPEDLKNRQGLLFNVTRMAIDPQSASLFYEINSSWPIKREYQHHEERRKYALPLYEFFSLSDLITIILGQPQAPIASAPMALECAPELTTKRPYDITEFQAESAKKQKKEDE